MAREISIRLSVEDADRVKSVLQSVGTTGEAAFSAFERGATSGAQSFAKLERSLDPVVAGQERFAAAQDRINRAVESGLRSQERGNQLLDLARQRYLGVAQAADMAATAGARSFSGIGGVAQSAGFQLQDFAVQVQGGTSAMTALSQQGSQFLGVFGPAGAIAGSVLAVGLLVGQMLRLRDVSAEVAAGNEAWKKSVTDLNELFESAAEKAARLREESVRSIIAAQQLIQQTAQARGDVLQQPIMALDDQLRAAEARRAATPGDGLVGRRLDANIEDMRKRLSSLRGDAEIVTREIQASQEVIERARNAGRLTGDEYGPPAPEKATARPRRDNSEERALNEMLREREKIVLSVETAYEKYERELTRLSDVSARAAAAGRPLEDDTIRRAAQKALDDLTKAENQTSAREQSQRQSIELLQREQGLVSANVQVREREIAILRERQKLDSENEQNTVVRSRRLALAAQIVDETQALKRQQDAWNELSNVGVQAFDRIGTAITTALANGQLSTIRFGNIAKSVMSEVLQYFAKVSLVNPVMNAVFGSNRTTLGDMGGIVGSIFGGSGGSGSAGTVMIDGISAAAYSPLADGAAGPVLSIPAGATYSVAGAAGGLGGLRGAGGSVVAAGGGIMSQLGMMSSGASIMNQLSGGSMYGSIGKYLGLSGDGGMFSGVGDTLSGAYNSVANIGLWNSGASVSGLTSVQAASPAFYGEAMNAGSIAGGSTAGGASAGTATLGSVAGGAAGVVGGAYGIYSGIEKGGVGGAFQVAGGAVTMAAGASSLLAAAGVIGASMGPVGWIVGAVLAIVGALLPGQKPSNREGNATFDFSADAMTQGGQTGSKFSQQNRDMSAGMLGGVVEVAARLEKTMGLNFTQKAAIGVGDRDGIYYRINDGQAVKFGRDEKGSQELAANLVRELVQQSAGSLSNAALRVPLQSGVKWDTLENALTQIQQLYEATNKARPSANQNIAAQNINWADFTNGLADLKWVSDVYDKLLQGETAGAKFARQLDELNTSFDNTAEKARQLGLSEDTVNQARARQIQGAYDQRDLEGLKLIQSQQNILVGFLDNMTAANASPAEKMQVAQDAFGKALDAARGADIRSADLGAVTRAAGNLLNANQAYYGTGGGASSMERFIRSSIESLGAQLQFPAFGGDIANTLEAVVSPLTDEMQQLRLQVKDLTEELRTTRLRNAA